MLGLFNASPIHTFHVTLGPYEFTVQAEDEEKAIMIAAARWWDDEDAMPLPINTAEAVMTA